MITRAGMLLVACVCDGCGAREGKHVAWSAEQTRDELQVLHGWRFNEGRDLCARCAAGNEGDASTASFTTG